MVFKTSDYAWKIIVLGLMIRPRSRGEIGQAEW